MFKLNKITKVWKFFYWPVVWLIVYVPAFVRPVYLYGFQKTIALVFGLILIGISLLLTSAGGRTLAQKGHQKDHKTLWPDKFIEFGIFNCMRHPMHLGLAIFPVALALISGSVPAILSSGWGVSGALWFVLQIEEKDALNKYGMVYSAYMQKVPPFSLRLRCIKSLIKSKNG